MSSRSANAVRARIVELCDQYGPDNVHVLEESDVLATVLVIVDATESDMDRFGGAPGGVVPFRFFYIRPEMSFAMPMSLTNMKLDANADGSVNFSGRFVHPPEHNPLDVFVDKLRGAGPDDHG